MQGIDGTPYIDCESFLDMTSLQELELEITSGIAMSKMQAGIYGPGIVESAKYGNFLFMKKEIESNPELVKKYRWDQMDTNQKRLFLKLYKNLYSPNNSVYLKEAKDMTNLQVYLDKANDTLYTWNDNIKHFPGLKSWLDELIGTVFTKFGRTLFFIHEHDCKLLTHRDGTQYRPHKTEFLWINPTGNKSFYIYDEATGQQHYVQSKAAFFNDLDMHGGDPTSSMTWSLRIDGVFTDEFRKKLGVENLVNY